jgi:hypothetical protein
VEDMENLFFAIVLWFLVIVIIPFERIKNLRKTIVISIILLFILEILFTRLGYYRFHNYYLGIAGIPVFYLTGGAAGGLLLVNWIDRSILKNVFIIFFFGTLLLFAEIIFVLRGAFEHLNGWNFMFSFILDFAGLSLLVWLSLAITGSELIYNGKKSRY